MLLKPCPDFIKYRKRIRSIDGVTPNERHPAKFNTELLEAISGLIPVDTKRILDCFCGVGTLGKLSESPLHCQRIFVGTDIEPEWVLVAKDNMTYAYCCDSRKLPFHNESFDAIVTSPAYGNRLADRYIGKGKASDKVRRTYAQYLDRIPTDGSSGILHWGDKYKQLHEAVWREALRVLRPGGTFILNIKNYINKGELVDAAGWHKKCLIGMGMKCERVVKVGAGGDENTHRNKSKGKQTVEHELVMLFRKED